jgi:hypothetical protein
VVWTNVTTRYFQNPTDFGQILIYIRVVWTNVTTRYFQNPTAFGQIFNIYKSGLDKGNNKKFSKPL